MNTKTPLTATILELNFYHRSSPGMHVSTHRLRDCQPPSTPSSQLGHHMAPTACVAYTTDPSDRASGRTPHKSCGAPGCGGRTTNRQDAAVGRPAATARALGGTRCHPRDPASIAAPRRPGLRGRAPRLERPWLAATRCGAPRPGRDNAARLRRMDRQTSGKYCSQNNLRRGVHPSGPPPGHASA
jgi:hypothetical protein